MAKKPISLGKKLLWADPGSMHLEAIPEMAHDSAIKFLIEATPKHRSEEGLLGALRKFLLLSPVRLGSLQHLKLFPPTNVNTRKGFTTVRRVAEARFGYTGSEGLWRYNPGLNQSFPFGGVFAITSLGFRAHVDGTDLGEFEQEALRQAAILSSLLPNLDKPAATFNAHIDPILQRIAHQWFSLNPEDAEALFMWPVKQARIKALLRQMR